MSATEKEFCALSTTVKEIPLMVTDPVGTVIQAGFTSVEWSSNVRT